MQLMDVLVLTVLGMDMERHVNVEYHGSTRPQATEQSRLKEGASRSAGPRKTINLERWAVCSFQHRDGKGPELRDRRQGSGRVGLHEAETDDDLASPTRATDLQEKRQGAGFQTPSLRAGLVNLGVHESPKRAGRAGDKGREANRDSPLGVHK